MKLFWRTRGFTLIEILVVIAIISIATGFVVYRFEFNKWNDIKKLGDQMTHQLRLGEQQSLLMSQTLGVIIHKQDLNYVFFLEDDDPNNASVWKILDDDNFASLQLPKNASWNLYLGNELATLEDKTKIPQIIISKNGEITPFALWMTMQGTSKRLVISGAIDGEIKMEEIDE